MRTRAGHTLQAGLLLLAVLGLAGLPGCGDAPTAPADPKPEAPASAPRNGAPAAGSGPIDALPPETPTPEPADPDAIDLAGFFEAMRIGDTDRREFAIYRLGVDFDPAALAAARARLLPALLGALEDASGSVRRGALMSLTRLGPHAEDAIMQILPLLGDPEVGVRAQAADLIGATAPDGPVRATAAAALRRALTDEVAVVRHNALQALTQLGVREVKGEAIVLTLLGSDPDDEVRVQAALALGELEYRSAATAAALIRALAHAHSEIRAAAAWSLGRLQLEAAQVVPRLEALLEDDTGEVRQAAQEALAGYNAMRGKKVK